MYDHGFSHSPSERAPEVLKCDYALFLDFDGTLVETTDPAADISVTPELPGLLMGLSHCLQGAVAVISGRSLSELDRYLSPAALAGAGLHGAELRLVPHGPIEANGLPELTRLAGSLGELYSNDPIVGVEHTDSFVKVLFENAPERVDEIRSVMTRLATSRTIEVIERSDCFEARPHGCGKGVAMRMLIEDATFRSRKPVFIGNGATDEAGFRTASAMGGFGVKIGEGETSATCRLRGVGDLHGWLASSLNVLS